MGLGTAFVRLSASDLEALAPELKRRLEHESHNDVVALLREKAQTEFQGWDRNCWALPGTLELLSHHYADAPALLGFLRTDRTRGEWQAHLERLPRGLAPVAFCDDVTLLAADERHALKAAWKKAEADRFSRVRSGRFALSPEDLPFLVEPLESEGIDVLVQEGDGERSWTALDEFPEVRPEGQLPPSVLEDQRRPTLEAKLERLGVTKAVDRVADAAVTGTSAVVSAFLFLFCAVVPLLAYPALLPDMLRSGDWGATAFTMGLLGGIGLLPLALVWGKLRRGWRLGVAAVHLLGVAVGVARFALY
jgi:hypothetical protein